jgi:hypothetical protein
MHFIFNLLIIKEQWKRESYQKKLWKGVHKEEENEEDLNSPRQKGLQDWWVKEDWNDTQMEEEGNIINK